jgi:hypothetical protein
MLIFKWKVIKVIANTCTITHKIGLPYILINLGVIDGGKGRRGGLFISVVK